MYITMYICICMQVVWVSECGWKQWRDWWQGEWGGGGGCDQGGRGGGQSGLSVCSSSSPLSPSIPTPHGTLRSVDSMAILRWPRSTFTFCISLFPFCIFRFPFASFCGVSPFPVFVFRISRFPFRSRIFLVAFAIDRFVFRASRFSFLVSCISFHINFLVLRSVIPVVPPLTRADFTELERRHRQMGGSN